MVDTNSQLWKDFSAQFFAAYGHKPCPLNWEEFELKAHLAAFKSPRTIQTNCAISSQAREKCFASEKCQCLKELMNAFKS